jgi:predicted sugar kinase
MSRKVVDILKSYERCKKEMEALEKATAVVAAMPAVIEEDTGVIKNEIQPATPLMRRQERSIMRDVVYKQMLQDTESGVAQSRSPQTDTEAFWGTNVSLHSFELFLVD